MTEIKEKPAEALTKPKANTKREAEATFRPILIAACVGVLIGLLIRR
jgi:hypothetical protein